MAGRPTTYTKKLGLKICREIAKGKSIRSICKEKGMPAPSTVFLWVIDTKHETFSEQYARAKECQCDQIFEELLEIADSTTVLSIAKARLRVDTRKFYLSKVLPKRFGDRNMTDLTIKSNGAACDALQKITESYMKKGE